MFDSRELELIFNFMVIILWNYPAKRQVPYKTNINFIYWQYICCLLWRTYAEKSNTVIYRQQLWIFQFKKKKCHFKTEKHQKHCIFMNLSAIENFFQSLPWRTRNLHVNFRLIRLWVQLVRATQGIFLHRSSVKPLVAENKGESYVTDKDLVKTCWLKPDATHKQCFEI